MRFEQREEERNERDPGEGGAPRRERVGDGKGKIEQDGGKHRERSQQDKGRRALLISVSCCRHRCRVYHLRRNEKALAKYEGPHTMMA